MKFVVLSIYLLLSSSGMILVKLGGSKTVIKFNPLVLNFDWKFIVGICFYGLSFLLWMYIINKYNLSYIYPIATGLLFVIVLLSSSFILKETMLASQIIGVILIVIGIIIANLKF